MTSKYIYRTYDESSVKGIEEGDREHERLINLGYRVSHTYSSPFTAVMTYELIGSWLTLIKWVLIKELINFL